ncbi:MAG: hypothetical protein Q7S57_02475 [bacterium]|nr:hypothetical protein [bacterium]
MLLVILLTPFHLKHDNNLPHLDSKYIRRVFGTSTVGQIVNSDYTTDSLDIMISGTSKHPSLIILDDTAGKELGRTQAQISPKPQWVRIKFSQPLPQGTQSLVLKTDTEINKESAILIHYQPDSRRYDKGNMLVSGNNSYGDIAFRLNEKMPLWKAAIVWSRITDKSIKQNRPAIFAAIFLPLLFVATHLLKNKTKSWMIYILPTIGLILLAIILHAPYTRLIEGVFGGDAFNYLSKTEALLHFEDFFATDPRKGPLLSILAIPGFITADPLLWSRWIGIMAAAGTVALITFIAKYFRLPWAIALGAGLLLAVNQDFIWEAPNGLANSLYAFTTCASLLSFLYARNLRRQAIFAILLGLTFLTRYEGALLALVLYPALFVRERLPLKKILLLLAITIGIVGLPQISYFWSGHSGIRTLSDINDDQGLSLAYSKEVLIANFSRLNSYVWNWWVTTGKSGHAVLSMVSGLVAGSLLAFRNRNANFQKFFNFLTLGAPSLLIVLMLVLSVSIPARTYVAGLPLFLCGVGLAWLLERNAKTTAVILLIIISQIFFITLIIPKSRYYLQIIPFSAFFMATGVYQLWKQKNNFLSISISLSVIGLLAGFFYVDGHDSLKGRLEKYNNHSQDTSVMIQAVRYLRSQYGIVAFRTKEEQSIQIYLSRERRKFFSPKNNENIAQQELDWIQSNDIKYLVERNRPENWQITQRFPDVFERLHTYDTIYGDSRVMIYTVHRDKMKEITF